MLKKKICKWCGKDFLSYESKSRSEKFCSKSCSLYWRHKNQPFSPFKKGEVGYWTGKKMPESFSANRKKEGNPNWKGDCAKNSAVHQWIRENYKKNGVCELCGSKKSTDWSNKYHTYKRDRGDWWELCRKCHFQWDLKMKPEKFLKNFYKQTRRQSMERQNGSVG